MLDSTNLLELIKKASGDALAAGDPADFCFGKVISSSPIKILVEQKMELGASQLVVPRSLTEHEQDIVLDGEAKTITVKNGLKPGENVVLMKKWGGQSYLVMDRVK